MLVLRRPSTSPEAVYDMDEIRRARYQVAVDKLVSWRPACQRVKVVERVVLVMAGPEPVAGSVRSRGGCVAVGRGGPSDAVAEQGAAPVVDVLGFLVAGRVHVAHR